MKKVISMMLWLAVAFTASGQASFTGEYTQDFNSFNGSTASTLPTGWTTSGSGGFKGAGTGTSTAGGFYAFYPSCCSGDKSLGALHSGSANCTYTGTFRNNTGSTITSLSVSYDFEQYRASGNTTGWSAVFNGSGNAALSAAGVTSGVSAGVPHIENRSTVITGISIANGATFYFSWTANDLSGSDNGVAIDNFQMCVPGKAFNVTASNNSPVGSPSPITFTASASGGTATYSYSWAGPAGFTSTSSAPAINPSAVANSGTYTVTVTDAIGCSASATTAVTVTASVACSGMPAGGTATAGTTAFCEDGATSLTVTGGESATGLTYQWQSSATGTTGTFSDISGATSAIYNTPTLTATTYYQLLTTCTASSSTSASTIAGVTINPLPAITVTPAGGTVCSGGSGISMTAGGADTYSWTPSLGLSATAGATVTANPTADVTYTVTGTDAATCVNTNTVSVTYALTPSSLSVTPATIEVCAGSAPEHLTATGGTAGPTTISSGTITLPSSVGAFSAMQDAIAVAGIPAGATITGASVKIISFGSQYQRDYVFNIKAPNGNVLNLINERGSSTSTVTTLFSNTNLSSAGGSLLSSGSGAFTGTWSADALTGKGIAPNVSNTTDWADLFSTPNGDWTLSIYNNTMYTNIVVPSAQWSITLDYTYQSAVTWTPTTDLYTDAAATTPYTGGAATEVYFDPATASVSTYTITATNVACTSQTTKVTTVNPVPAAIGGTLSVCVDGTTTLTNDTAGGTWSSSDPAIGSINATGELTGITAGTIDITYALPTGCQVTAVATVNPLPAVIAGAFEICEAGNTILTNDTTGGTWSSAVTTVATIDAGGVLEGILAGTTNITYTLPTGCIATQMVTVNPLPAAIAGTTNVCVGLMQALTNDTTGGTWSSSDPATGTIDAVGTVTGIAAGTTTISYSLATGCQTTTAFTVNALPAAIAGATEVCEAATTTLTDGTTGGAWSSSDVAIATIDAAGVLNGILAGDAEVTYTLPTGCIATAAITVNPLPAVIVGTMDVCVGLTTTLTNDTTGGTWSSSDIAVGTIDASGILSGLTDGTTTVTYALPTTCQVITEITVNPLPAAITGSDEVCTGANTTLASTTGGGSWSSTANATAAAGGIITGVTAGTTAITYTLPTGCITSKEMTVNQSPDDITGTAEVCAGLTTTLSSTTTGGTWTSGSADATIDGTTGVVTGVNAGVVAITYSVSNGCTDMTDVTVNPLPAAIGGTFTVCEAGITTLTITGGGTWASSGTEVAIGSTTGIASGVSAGTATITYTLPTGCIITQEVTVNPLPAAISGTFTVCEAGTTTLTNTGGGTWSSSGTEVTIGSTTGIASGVSAGTANITYTLATGCITTQEVTVNPLPTAIGGTAAACEGLTATLTSSAGGTWSSSTTNATISTTGVVTGVTAGTSDITYALPTGCLVAREFTVNPLPAAISGSTLICLGSTNTLTNTGGGTWASSNANATAGSATGMVTGVATGTATITYTLPTGCITTTVVTVHALTTPSVLLLTGTPGTLCTAVPVTFIASPTNGGTAPVYSWEVNGVVMPATIDTFVHSPVSGDVVRVKLTSNATCATPDTAIDMVTLAVTTSGTPAVTVNATPGTSVCAGTPVTFTEAHVFGGSLPTFRWTVNGATVSTATSYTYTPANTDVVKCILTSSFVCRTADSGTSVASTMNVDTQLPPAVTITADPGLSIGFGQTVTFTATLVGGGTTPTYQWLVNTTTIAGATNATYTTHTLANGDVITCNVVGSGPCGLPSFNTVVVSVSNVGVNNVTRTIANVVVTPNPNNGAFNVRGAWVADEAVTMELTNMLGQIVYHNEAIATSGTIDQQIITGNTLPAGTYLLSVRSVSTNAVVRVLIQK